MKPQKPATDSYIFNCVCRRWQLAPNEASVIIIDTKLIFSPEPITKSDRASSPRWIPKNPSTCAAWRWIPVLMDLAPSRACLVHIPSHHKVVYNGFLYKKREFQEFPWQHGFLNNRTSVMLSCSDACSDALGPRSSPEPRTCYRISVGSHVVSKYPNQNAADINYPFK